MMEFDIAQILGALIVTLSLLWLAWRVGHVIERLDSIQFAAKVRHEAIEKWWQVHKDSHAQDDRHRQHMETHFDAHLTGPERDAIGDV